MFKRIFSILILATLLLNSYNVFGSQNNIKVIVDGKEINFDQPPINDNGRVLVPVRPIAEALGLEVEYYPEYPNTVTVNDTKIKGRSSIIYWGEHHKGYVKSYFANPNQAIEVKFDPVPKVVNGRTLLGLRNLADIFDTNVEWDGNSQIAIVSSKKNLEKRDELIEENTEKDVLTFKEMEMNTSTLFNEGKHQELISLYKEYQKDYELEVVRLVNVERKKAGLSEVVLDDRLMNVARVKAEEMATLNYYNHESPKYGKANDMIKLFNIVGTVGENITINSDTPNFAIDAWLNSTKGHRENLLNSDYTKIGVGFSSAYDTQSDYVKTYWSLFLMY